MTSTGADDHVVAAAGAVREAIETVRTMLPDARAGALSVELTATSQLELCQCRCDLGELVVGLVTSTPCVPEWRAWLPRALALAAAEPYRKELE